MLDATCPRWRFGFQRLGVRRGREAAREHCVRLSVVGRGDQIQRRSWLFHLLSGFSAEHQGHARRNISPLQLFPALLRAAVPLLPRTPPGPSPRAQTLHARFIVSHACVFPGVRFPAVSWIPRRRRRRPSRPSEGTYEPASIPRFFEIGAAGRFDRGDI